MSARWLPVCALLLLLHAPGASSAPPSHAAPTLDARIAAILPKPSEDRWLQVPWRTNLMQARQEAQAAGKPLFLWVMVGNPQGCT
jgi:hypothetical protein